LIEADAETGFEIVAKANEVLATEGEAVEFVHVDAALTIQGRQEGIVLKQHVVAAARIETLRQEAAEVDADSLLGRGGRNDGETEHQGNCGNRQQSAHRTKLL
jgi:hypothetical protein